MQDEEIDQSDKEENHSTASEGSLLPDENKSMAMGTSYDESKEQDLDDLLHRQADVAEGSLPDPEVTASNEEGAYENNKISDK